VIGEGIGGGEEERRIVADLKEVDEPEEKEEACC
jgi:hypothetical protein